MSVSYLYSSIGMAKAALEALNGLNLFGENGCPQSTIHVDPDAQYRNCLILNTLLPRESTSKVSIYSLESSILCLSPSLSLHAPSLPPSLPPLSLSLSLSLSPLSLPHSPSPPLSPSIIPQETDASLLTVTGYPAFAIDDVELCHKTEEKVRTTLAGEKGYKRFLRDSYLTVREGGREFKEPVGDTSVSAGTHLLIHCRHELAIYQSHNGQACMLYIHCMKRQAFTVHVQCIYHTHRPSSQGCRGHRIFMLICHVFCLSGFDFYRWVISGWLVAFLPPYIATCSLLQCIYICTYMYNNSSM